MQKLSRRKFIGTAVGIAGATALPAGAAVAAPAGTTLYARLGGYDAIAAVVDDVQGRWAKDTQLAKFFRGLSQDSLRKIRQRRTSSRKASLISSR